MIEFEDREIDRAMALLASQSTRDDAEIVTLNGREMIYQIARNTPRHTGVGRAGWWPSWIALGRSGAPITRRRYGAQKVGRGRKARTYVAEGYFKDDRRNVGNASVEFVNTTHAVINGKRLNYLYISDARGPNAGWMARAERETTFNFHRLYERNMRRRSAR